MKSIVKHLKKYAACYMTMFCGVFWLTSSLAAPATDPLAATMKPEVQALFGSGSTISYCIYIAEIVLGGIAYVKSKNLLLLIGVPILMIFTHTMFALIA